MSVDLKSFTMFERASLVILDDALIKLEHERTKDRVRKYLFESIESVVISRKMPWGRVIVVAVAFGLPGVALFFFNSVPTTVFGSILTALAIGLIVGYAYCRK